jgi:hypothetical protein
MATRETTPLNSDTKRVRGASSSLGKENAGNSRPASSGAKMAARADARASRMAKPLSAQTIFEQKSSELADSLAAADAAGKSLSDAMDEEAEALPPLTTCPIALALRGEDRDYGRVEGVLETKLSGKPPAGIQGMKERLEEQKLVIKDLRAVGKTLLSRCGEAEQVAAAFIAQHEAAAAKVEAERDTLLSERDVANAQVAALGTEKDDVEKRLNSALASFAAVDEQRRAGLEERDSARAQLALKTAAEESCRQELGRATAVYIYVYTHTHTHTHTHTNTHTHIYTCNHVYMYTCTHACT